MLDATRLRVLVAIAKYGSVTGAAQALNYAQPSISHHIARLEAETGAKLMERAGRGVKLTDAGQLLAERAEEILGRLDAAEAELALHVGQRKDRVRLAAFGSALSTLVAAAGAALHAEHANLDIQLTQAEPDQALRLLKAGETDIALIFRYLRDGTEPASMASDARVHHDRTSPSDEESNVRTVLDEPVYLISRECAAREGGVRKGDLGRRGDLGRAAPPSGSDSELRRAILAAHADQSWIGADERCTEFALDLCRSAGFVPEITTRSANHIAAQALAAAGLGVTILPGLALRAASWPDRTAARPDTAARPGVVAPPGIEVRRGVVARPGIEVTELPGARRQILAVTYPASPDATAVTRLSDALVSAAT